MSTFGFRTAKIAKKRKPQRHKCGLPALWWNVRALFSVEGVVALDCSLPRKLTLAIKLYLRKFPFNSELSLKTKLVFRK